MTSFPLVHVDLGLESFDFLGLDLEQLLNLKLLLHDVSLLFIIFVDEDGFVRIIDLFVKIQLLLTKLTDQVQQVGVVFHLTSEITLSVIELSLGVLNHLDALLLSLGELIGKLHNLGRWSRYLQVVQVNDVTEPEHLPVDILALSDLTDLLVLLDLLHLGLLVDVVAIIGS